MPLLGLEHYDSVRRAIDLTLTRDEVPDEVIGDYLYAPAAEAEVLARDALATTYSETADPVEWAAVRRAAIYLTAALLVPAIPRLASETWADGDARVQWEKWDLAAKAAELRARASAALDSIREEPVLSGAVGGFWTIPGYRGR